MSNKEIFMNEFNLVKEQFSEEAIAYVESLKTPAKEKPLFTDTGIKILSWFQNDKPSSPVTAKEIAEQLGEDFTARKITGAIRKLVTDGYVEKIEGEPTTYAITEKGATALLGEPTIVA